MLRGWPTLTIDPLSPKKPRADRAVPRPVGQGLECGSCAAIAAAPQSANPLYLRALLDELRVFGAHEQLEVRIAYYLAAQTIPSCISGFSPATKKTTSRTGPTWFATRCGSCGRRVGSSPEQLLDLLGEDRQPLPSAWWSPLYLAAEQALVSRSGLIGFFHDYLRQAVAARYLPSEQERHGAHQRLAHSFPAQEIGARKIDELPWQLAEAKAYPKLYDLLTDLNFFVAAFATNKIIFGLTGRGRKPVTSKDGRWL